MDCLPDWTDQFSSRAATGGGVLETAFRMSLGAEWAFEITFSSDEGERGADMLIQLEDF